ncbi:MAG: PAS domain S-box protein [Candidatus Omnitrophota bacterium]|jgi:PAS domain S-box-containing protein
MHPVAYFDSVSFLASLAAIVILLIGWNRIFRLEVKFLLFGLLAFSAFYYLCLFLEWAGVTKALETTEDLVGALIPVVWAFVFYALLKEIAERSLRQSEEKFRSIVETAGNVIIFLSPEYKILEFNPEAEKLYGMKKKDAIGQDYLDLFVPREIRGDIIADVKKVLGGRPTKAFENPVKTTAGSERIVSWNVTRVLDAQGRSAGIIAVGQDVTEKKLAEEKIKDIARFPAENPNPVMRVDSEGTILYANLPSMILLEHWGAGVGQNVPEDWRERVASVITSRHKRAVDIKVDERVFSVTIAPVENKNYANLYALDVTYRRKKE